MMCWAYLTTNWLSIENKALIHSVCQFPCCKYSSHGLFLSSYQQEVTEHRIGTRCTHPPMTWCRLAQAHHCHPQFSTSLMVLPSSVCWFCPDDAVRNRDCIFSWQCPGNEQASLPLIIKKKKKKSKCLWNNHSTQGMVFPTDLALGNVFK